MSNRHSRSAALAGLLTVLLCQATPALAAGDPAAGREKAKTCSTCHGPLGLSQMPGAPNLAGQPQMYLHEQLRAFKQGKRVHQIMNVVAAPLSEADMDDLSAWFSSLQISVAEP